MQQFSEHRNALCYESSILEPFGTASVFKIFDSNRIPPLVIGPAVRVRSENTIVGCSKHSVLGYNEKHEVVKWSGCRHPGHPGGDVIFNDRTADLLCSGDQLKIRNLPSSTIHSPDIRRYVWPATPHHGLDRPDGGGEGESIT